METVAVKKVSKTKKPRWSELPITSDKLLDIYRKMLVIRRFEERAAQEYGKGKIGGFCHLYIGQEAVGVGALAALREDDYIYTSYRDHGQAIARGIDPKAAMAELFGKVTGCSMGMGGSMHFYDAKKGFMGGWGIVGGHPPLAAGTAFATKYQGKDSVTVCFFGEAASNQGVFYETLNLAMLWKLPVIFICENNRYGMGTAIERASAGSDLFDKAAGFHMDRAAVDGMDVVAMYKAVTEAVQRARKNFTPTMLEARTYRFRGHSMSDPGTYRTKEEVEEYKRMDPISTFGAELIEHGIVAPEELESIDDEIKKEIAEAVAFADNSPEPPLDLLEKYVYSY